MKKSRLLGAVCACLAATSLNAIAEDVSISFSATDLRSPILTGDSGDRSATGSMSLQNSDTDCTRSVDGCSFKYRLTSQASADDGFFTSNNDSANYGGDVNFQLTLGNGALWNILVDVHVLGTLARDDAGPAVVSAANIYGFSGALNDPTTTLSLSSGSTLSTTDVDYHDFGTTINALNPVTGTITVNSNVSCASGGSFDGECISTMGAFSTLSSFDLDNAPGIVDPNNDGMFVTVTATPHLNFSGQTLVSNVTIANGESLTGYGSVNGSVTGVSGSSIQASGGGSLFLGDASSVAGFSHQGSMDVGNKSVTLRDADSAELGISSTIAGGRLSAANGFSLDGADAISGYGRIDGVLTGTNIESRLTATGNYVLSNANLSVASDHITLLSQDSVGVSSVAIDGGLLRAAGGINLASGGNISGNGEVRGGVVAGSGTSITADTGDLTLGDIDSFDGFRAQGAIDAGSNTITLKSKQFATLGSLTTISGGALNAENGVFLEGGNAITGNGSINARIAARTGSTISAEGNMSLGDENALDGYFSQGVLEINNNTVTINDNNEGVLGSLNTIGNEVGDGTLQSANGLLLPEGHNLVGHGIVNDGFTNQGYVEGTGSLSIDKIEFTGDVTGSGDYAGNVLFSGSFSPGNSPEDVSFESVAFGFDHVLIMEIAGLLSGDKYDVLSGTPGTSSAVLDGILDIDLLDMFAPSNGDYFDLIMAESITGDFTSLLYPELTGGLLWDLTLYEDFSGMTDVLRLSVSSVPVPAAVWLFGSGFIGLVGVARRKKA